MFILIVLDVFGFQISRSQDFQFPRIPDFEMPGAAAAGRTFRSQLDLSPKVPRDQLRRKEPGALAATHASTPAEAKTRWLQAVRTPMAMGGQGLNRSPKIQLIAKNSTDSEGISEWSNGNDVFHQC